jgi:hypothetical protein
MLYMLQDCAEEELFDTEEADWEDAVDNDAPELDNTDFNDEN